MRQLVDRSFLGDGLLPRDLENGRARYASMLSAAYSKILSNAEENFGMWEAVRRSVIAVVRKRFQADGWTAPPFNAVSLWERIDRPVPAIDREDHVRLVRALMTNNQRLLLEHIDYRMANEGNVHLQFSGPTGMAKSSCAISLMDWIKPLDAAKLLDHLAFDASEIPKKLRPMTRGDTLLMDEYLQLQGEGSRTVKAMIENMEDTLRGTGVCLFICSPRSNEHGTMQAELELVLWNPGRKASLFVVWIDGRPHGVVALPWAPAPLWAAYKPFKDANLERTKAGQFRDTLFVAKMAMASFDDPKVIEYLVAGANKPKKGDFTAAVRFFQGQSVSAAQQDAVASMMFDWSYSIDRVREKFEWMFGVAINEGLRKVAAKCYSEA